MQLARICIEHVDNSLYRKNICLESMYYMDPDTPGKMINSLHLFMENAIFRTHYMKLITIKKDKSKDSIHASMLQTYCQKCRNGIYIEKGQELTAEPTVLVQDPPKYDKSPLQTRCVS